MTGCKAAAESAAVKLPAPMLDSAAPAAPATETAVFAGGCFWGVQAVFQHTQGVLNAVSGYSGGPREHAIYDYVSAGLTTHAEAVQITYDPKQISYGRLLQILFSVAYDPTQLTPLTAFYPAEPYHQDYATQNPNSPYIAQFDRPKIISLMTLMPEVYRETPVLVSVRK